VLKQLLANAKERGHVVDEGVFRVKAPRREQPEMRFLGWDEVEELAANTVAPYGNLVLLAALTGLRQGELFAVCTGTLISRRRRSRSSTASTKASSCP
jgi:integrase